MLTPDQAVLIMEYVGYLHMLEKAYWVSIGLACISSGIFAYLSFRSK
jgi:hypothetical protein